MSDPAAPAPDREGQRRRRRSGTRIPLPELDRNGRLLIAAKGVRSFAFGLDAVALGLYMAALGLPGPTVGLVLSGALFGSMLLTLVIATRGDRIGRRRILAVGATLMLLAVFIPFAGANPAVLVLLALTGMVGVTANESVGLQTIDQAALPQTVPAKDRTAVFALYSVVAAVAAALGALAAGVLGEGAGAFGLSGPGRYAPAFTAYAIAGLVALGLALALGPAVEADRRPPGAPALGRASRGLVARLSLLFGLDSFASGFIVQSFLAYWFATRFAIAPVAIGALFSAASVLAAVSFPLAAALASRIGLVPTMVSTHIPASALLILMAFAPSGVLASALFLVRAALASMDQPARQAYTMSVVRPSERTATAGITNLARTGAQAAAPLVAGTLLVPLGVGVPLVAAGVLKVLYDLALFASFRGRVPDAAADPDALA